METLKTATLALPRSLSDPSENADEPTPGAARSSRLSVAVVYCENCRAETPHRILRLDRTTRLETGHVRGIARCRECRWTHPFESAAAGRVKLTQILSVGRVSERSQIELPAHRSLQVGSGLPGSSGRIRIQRIDTRDGQQVPSASTDDIATVWVVQDVGAIVPVSIVEGRRTRAARLIVPRRTRYAVGDRVTVASIRLEIVALRARGKTWRRPGDAFDAEEVQRVYGRRVPLGSREPRRPRTERGEPVSSGASTSRPGRSRPLRAAEREPSRREERLENGPGDS